MFLVCFLVLRSIFEISAKAGWDSPPQHFNRIRNSKYFDLRCKNSYRHLGGNVEKNCNNLSRNIGIPATRLRELMAAPN